MSIQAYAIQEAYLGVPHTDACKQTHTVTSTQLLQADTSEKLEFEPQNPENRLHCMAEVEMMDNLNNF